ncbi:hypothetical protein DYU11_18255 [Fibrisoma montanum]|uniref:Uncharacterized protein n=1 Tax=Fibrisoma montanum TaxID=2305895 RepID=A0A418M5W8_9BACT|nr:hypothetical protein [Fibrisoma montanum]RIV21349.1 hypothetical protein DYU11_18255 [Fibrisoma montanum]
MKTVQEVKSYLRNGDMTKIAKMAGVTRKHADVILRRPTSKRFEIVFKAAKKIASANQRLGI